MPETRAATLRVVVIAETETQRGRLKALLEANGVEVVAERGLGECQKVALDPVKADVLLINLDDAMDEELENLEMLIERSPWPILFNENASANSGAHPRSLIAKLTQLAGSPAPAPEPEVTPARPVLRVVSSTPEWAVAAAEQAEPAVGDTSWVDVEADTEAERGSDGPPADAEVEPARQVWVLGASLGGPPALKRFFGALSPGLPVCFVLAQHIGGGFVKLLADQLNRCSAVDVMPACSGRLVRHGEVLLVPVGERFAIDDDGRVELLPEKRQRLYRPSVDDVLQAVGRRYGAASGAIIFSGMGADGARGCVDLAESGGVVWAQDADSCIISSMPDAARLSGTVSYSGTPEALAQRLADFVDQ
ncbi:MAG: chemotaxis protein CheB [Gammaproteobacteria bacterium]|jgi:chemosensory pili system protein ChpB (putative protein-glutamate methylesterase)